MVKPQQSDAIVVYNSHPLPRVNDTEIKLVDEAPGDSQNALVVHVEEGSQRVEEFFLEVISMSDPKRDLSSNVLNLGKRLSYQSQG